MKALLINGSPRPNGCTFTALTELANTLEAEGIETEIVHVGNKDIRGCIACRRCHSKVHLTRRADLHGRYRPQRRTVQLGDHLFHRCAPAVVLSAAQGAPGGGQLGQPHIPGGIKGKAGQLTVHRQHRRRVTAIGAHKVALALFQRGAIVDCGIYKAVPGADAVHVLIPAQIQRALIVGCKGRLCCTGVLPDIRRGVA